MKITIWSDGTWSDMDSAPSLLAWKSEPYWVEEVPDGSTSKEIDKFVRDFLSQFDFE